MAKIIKFSTPFCGQCKVVEANLKKIGVKYDSVDCEEQPSEANKYDIRNVPTIIVVGDDGEVVQRIMGIVTPQRLKEILEPYAE